MLLSNIVKIAYAVALFALSATAFGAENPPLLDTMTEELQRNFAALKQKADPAPYYLAYEVTDLKTSAVGASLGVLNSSGENRRRYLDITMRVGETTYRMFIMPIAR